MSCHYHIMHCVVWECIVCTMHLIGARGLFIGRSLRARNNKQSKYSESKYSSARSAHDLLHHTGGIFN